MTDRCTGHCCRAFILPLSPAEVGRALEVHRHLVETGEWKPWIDDKGDSRSHVKEFDVIGPMVEPIDPEGADIPLHLRWALSNGYHLYRCKNLTASGDCGIYEARPGMCRDYPYGGPCKYATCTWDAGRAGAHPPPRPPEFVQIKLEVT